MSFALYLIGLVIFIAGMAWGLITAGISGTYVAITCVIAAGIGIMAAVSRTRTKDIST